jgi:uncharacterized protein YprB with RNaseH-like and TPR domain
MSADLRDRLRRLGVHKGAGQLKPATPLRGTARDASSRESGQRRDQGATLGFTASSASSVLPAIDPAAPLWNLELTTSFGRAFVRRTVFPLSHLHGGSSLQRAFSQPASLLARLGNGATPDLRAALFLDTETTGLAGGAGTLVFLIGVGYLVKDAGDAFVVDQYFLPDPVEETGMLCALDQCLNDHGALVTFNGRGFDVPLLETRFTLARIAPSFSDHAHLDLLMPARRVWRLDLGSCSLGSLECHVLNVRRDQQDIPGFLIPQLYREYLHTGNLADMQRVMYHNLHDILSMVTLVTRLCGAIHAPHNPGEYLAAGIYYESAGQLREAEETYRAALEHSTGTGTSRKRIAVRLATCLKQQDRRTEAVPYWLQLADMGDVDALIELAKHYEWCEVDLRQAHTCASRALSLSYDSFTRAQINHRIQRLTRKLSRPANSRAKSAKATGTRAG